MYSGDHLLLLQTLCRLGSRSASDPLSGCTQTRTTHRKSQYRVGRRMLGVHLPTLYYPEIIRKDKKKIKERPRRALSDSKWVGPGYKCHVIPAVLSSLLLSNYISYIIA